MSQFVAAVVNGVAVGVPLFLIASGLTLIFGVMGILNFAHGGYFMIGAYVLVTVVTVQSPSLGLFVLGALAAAVLLGLIGLVSERVVFAPLYREGHITNLLASYALLLILDGAAVLIWGTSGRAVDVPEVLAGSVRLGFITEPRYNLFLIGVGAVAAAGLWFLLERSDLGSQIRAVAYDRTMARALGVRAGLVGTGVFVLGSGLAGLGGGLAAPLLSVAPGIANAFVVQSFAVVIIGGLGSVNGALAAAVVLGLANSFLVSYAPGFAAYSLYVAVAAVLLLRPEGIFSAATSEGRA